MASFTDHENLIINAYIPNKSTLITSLLNIKEAMEEIWRDDAPRVIKDHTDHGIKHSERLVEWATKLLNLNFESAAEHKTKPIKMSSTEAYYLLAGIYLHDIGMQCDVSKYPQMIEIANELGAKFNVEFTAKDASNYSSEEQAEIRRNHHFLTAAWIKDARKSGNNLLSTVVQKMTQFGVKDLMDVCMYHSKLPITQCDREFSDQSNDRKRMVAALLRFSDELDTNDIRVSLQTVTYFSVSPEHSVHWWLHALTKIELIGLQNSLVRIRVGLEPQDFKSYRSLIENIVIKEFERKNREVMEILSDGDIPLSLDYSSKVVLNEFAPKLPPEIIDELNTIYEKITLSLSSGEQSNDVKKEQSNDVKKEQNNDVKNKFEGDICSKYFNVPDCNKYFTGREDVIKAMEDTFKSSGSAIFAICGQEGIGKTEVAVIYAHRHKMEYEYIFWVNAKSIDSIKSAYIDIAKRLNLQEANEFLELNTVFAVKRWLRTSQNWLLIFDDASDPSIIGDFTPGVTMGHILITSRERDFTCLGISNPYKLELLPQEKVEEFFLRFIGQNNVKQAEMNAIITLAKKYGQTPKKMVEAAVKLRLSNLSPIEYLNTEDNDAVLDFRNPLITVTNKDAIEEAYEGTIYGERYNHFLQEKKLLAKEVVKNIGDYLSTTWQSNRKVCLLIDAGTTSYHVFQEVSEIIKDKVKGTAWKNRVYIVTNNLPGVQYLMMNCKEEDSMHSKVAINCFLLPGKPLTSYGAVASKETTDFIIRENFEQFLYNSWNLKKGEYKLIGITSASYVVRHKGTNKRNYFYPIARKEGHVAIKRSLAKNCDELFLIAPLMKFSFADVKLLNNMLGYTEETDSSQKLAYTEIPINKDKCIFFITNRSKNCVFSKFSDSLHEELRKSYKTKNLVTVNFPISNFFNNIPDFIEKEICMEIPHDNLRSAYYEGKNIWSLDCVDNQKIKHN
ncbi:MAG TPA: hypothetical protein HA262_13030 [Methanosarcina sp.]|jgi:hypothetical protein|nr:hypothetical protein [Methanosarcina sp.]